MLGLLAIRGIGARWWWLVLMCFTIGAALPNVSVFSPAAAQDGPATRGGVVPYGTTSACLADNLQYNSVVTAFFTVAGGYRMYTEWTVDFDCTEARTSACAADCYLIVYEQDSRGDYSRDTHSHFYCPDSYVDCGKHGVCTYTDSWPNPGAIPAGKTYFVAIFAVAHDPTKPCDKQDYWGHPVAGYFVTTPS